MSFGLIMAGGQGTRFWPYSTTEIPKQFLSIVGNQPLILQTYNRLKAFIKSQDIFIVADKKYLQLTKKSIPGFQESNFIAEPSPKNTAPCLILTNIVLSRLDSEASILVVPADHYIPETDIFRQQMQDALAFADKQQCMVTAGIKPTMPHTGYGYINFDRSGFSILNKTEFFPVKHFKEKPKLTQARQYVRKGNYYWNSGMFVYKLKYFKTFMKKYNAYYSDMYEKLESAFADKENFNRIFNRIIPESIDYALMEKVKEVKMLAAEFFWNDVGAWSSVYELNQKDADNNVNMGNHLTLDTRNSLLFSTENIPIAAIGLVNMAVIHTKNGILVASLNELQRVKDIIRNLK